MTTSQRDGLIVTATLSALGTASSFDIIPRRGATCFTLGVKAAGAATIDAWEMDEYGNLYHLFGGIAQPVVAGVDQMIPIPFPLNNLRVTMTDLSNALNAVKVNLAQGGGNK